MGMCERIKTNRVIYDEGLLTVSDNETIDFSQDLPPGTTIQDVINPPATSVNLRKCDLSIIGNSMSLTNVSFLVIKMVTAVLSDFTTITKDVSFNTPSVNIPLAKSIGSSSSGGIDFPATDQSRAICQFFNVKVQDNVTVASETTVNDNLTITFTVKIAVEDQLVVALCQNTVTIGIPNSSGG